ncbi:unnamed protein product [Durusdinium trenchii]|uniref:Phytanoyl-CoA dioxygenase n=2 Tax=Durusdinium trenchii TaxID=1381693 RepID=A0ABP0P2Z7_9DINO
MCPRLRHQMQLTTSEVPSTVAEALSLCEGRVDTDGQVPWVQETGESLSLHTDVVCRDAKSLELAASERERRLGYWRPSQLRRAFLLRRICGLLLVQDVFDIQVLANVSSALQHISQLETERSHRVAESSRVEASRGHKRREVKVPLQHPFTHQDLLSPPLLRSLVQLLLGNRIELDTFSFIESRPGSTDQPWHFDVPLPDFGLKGVAPSVGLVSVVPLVNVMPTNGATEFLPGSHCQAADRRFWMDAETKSVLRLQPSLTVGSLALFDLGLRHRGAANSGDSSRTILYMSYVHEWFRDAINFPEPQSSAWHSWTPTTKRLLSRLDSRRYLQELETRLGVVSQSTGEGRRDLEL